MSEFRNQAILDVAETLDLQKYQIEVLLKTPVIIYAVAQRERVLELERGLCDCRITLERIFEAKWRKWEDGLNTPEEFIAWAKNRAFG